MQDIKITITHAVADNVTVMIPKDAIAYQAVQEDGVIKIKIDPKKVSKIIVR